MTRPYTVIVGSFRQISWPNFLTITLTLEAGSTFYSSLVQAVNNVSHGAHGSSAWQITTVLPPGRRKLAWGPP